MGNETPSYPPEIQDQPTYIDGKPELFNTKVLRIVNEEPETADRPQLLIVSRDPGSAAALLPVVEILSARKKLGLELLTDGRAEETFRANFHCEDETPANSLGADKVIGDPDVILADASSSEGGLETYANATFPTKLESGKEIPMVLLEDYYTNAMGFLTACRERKEGLRFPKRICVLDEEAKNLILQKFPELAETVVVTGQPSFDSIAREDTEAISSEVRGKLGIKPEDNLIAFMSTPTVTIDQLKKIAEKLAAIGTDFRLAFRRHPRDNTTLEEYLEMFDKLGIKYVDTEQFSTDEVSAASNQIITTWSTEGLRGIYRRKSTIHILDDSVLSVPPKLKESAFPPAKLGASVEIDDIGDLTQTCETLLDVDSDEYRALQTNMDNYYPRDGKNAERVADVVSEVLA